MVGRQQLLPRAFDKRDYARSDSKDIGPSSNIAFTRNIRRALYTLLSRPTSSRQQVLDARNDHRLNIPHRLSLDVSRPPTPEHRHQPPSWPTAGAGEAGSLENEDDSGGYCPNSLCLPPDDEMDTLVSRFFADTGLLFPFVHGPSFLETYHRVKATRFRRFRRSWLGLLNAILAMATVTSAASSATGVTATDRGARAEVYYTRAKALCLDQMLNGATLETGMFVSVLKRLFLLLSCHVSLDC